MCIRPTWWLYFAAFCQHLIKHVMMMTENYVEYPLNSHKIHQNRSQVLFCKTECRHRDVTVSFKPSFHYPSWRPVNSGAFFDTRQLGPSSRESKNAPAFRGKVNGPSTRVHFLTPVKLGRVDGCQKIHGPSTRAVNSGSGNRALSSVRWNF